MCGGSAKTKQNSVSTYTPTAQATGVYNNILDRADDASQTAYNPATGKSIAAFNPTQQQGFDAVQANQGAWNPAVGQAGQMVTDAGAPISEADMARYTNPWQEQVVEAALTKIRNQDAMQNREFTANQAAQSGLGGNGVFVGRAQLQGNQAEARNATIAQLMSQGFTQAQAAAQADKMRGLQAGQTMAGIGQLTSQLGYNDAAALAASGNQQQQQQQNVNDAASANASAETLWPMQTAQWLASIGAGIGPLTGGTTTSQGTATQSQGKGIGNIIGAGLSAASMLSDERAKENKEPIGKTFDGQTIWKYNYVGDPRTQIGLIAQEVEQSHPEAVAERGDGAKMVNYDEALSGSYADGGGVFGGMPTAMPWASINPATPIIPQAPSMSAPQQEQGDGGFADAMAMGKKAGTGIADMFHKMDGANGWGASIVPTSSLTGGGSSGFLSGLTSLFGFADGGLVATPEEMAALEMVESGGRNIQGPVTRSGERAQGPRQIMPSTASDPGFGVKPLRPGAGVDEQRKFSDEYFNAMLRRYGGDRDAARIAYNGGPRRADTWIKAGRDDSVIPRESADYYKKIGRQLTPAQQMAGSSMHAVASGSDGAGTAPLVQKGMSSSTEGGQRYTGKGDRAAGGLLKSLFGIEFNPLNLNENERRALLVAGLSMMSHGDIGRGGIAGMQYLAGAEEGERNAQKDALLLRRQMDADERAVQAAVRAERRESRADTREERLADAEQKRLDLAQKEYDLKTKQGPGKSDAAKRAIDAGLTPGTPEYNDYVLKGPEKAAKAAELPGEIGARIGLGREFEKDIPFVRERIAKFKPTDYVDLQFNRGDAGEVWRRIEGGRDALVRGLTGAGIGVAEAQNQAARYQIEVTDRPETMQRKVDLLHRHLRAVENGAITGKTGEMARNFDPDRPLNPDEPRTVRTETINPDGTTAPRGGLPAPRPAGTDEQIKAWAANAIRKGAPAATVNQRLQQWGVSP
jgi:hypothetical protein